MPTAVPITLSNPVGIVCFIMAAILQRFRSAGPQQTPTLVGILTIVLEKEIYFLHEHVTTETLQRSVR